ncbi:unnamed protein product [Boreogadus saida]
MLGRETAPRREHLAQLRDATESALQLKPPRARRHHRDEQMTASCAMRSYCEITARRRESTLDEPPKHSLSRRRRSRERAPQRENRVSRRDSTAGARSAVRGHRRRATPIERADRPPPRARATPRREPHAPCREHRTQPKRANARDESRDPERTAAADGETDAKQPTR